MTIMFRCAYSEAKAITHLDGGESVIAVTELTHGMLEIRTETCIPGDSPRTARESRILLSPEALAILREMLDQAPQPPITTSVKSVGEEWSLATTDDDPDLEEPSP